MSFQVTPVATSALLPVQSAIVARCDLLLSRPLYDYVPEDAEYPYVTTGEATEVPDNAQGRFGRRVTHTLHVWDKGRQGFVQCLELAAELQELFDHREREVTVDGYDLVAIRFNQARPMRDPDPLIHHTPVVLVFEVDQLPL